MEFIYSQFRSNIEPTLSHYSKFAKVLEEKVGILQVLNLEPMLEEPRIVFKTKDLNIRKTLAKINVPKDKPCFLWPLNFCDNSSTKCLKHGTTGFMAFDYVRKLLEVVHTFEDCVFKFPRCQLAHGFQDGYSSKYCFQCFTKLPKKTDIYVFRDHLFCSLECRYEAYLVHLYNEKVMKTILGDYGSDSLSRMDEHNNFTIGSN